MRITRLSRQPPARGSSPSSLSLGKEEKRRRYAALTLSPSRSLSQVTLPIPLSHCDSTSAPPTSAQPRKAASSRLFRIWSTFLLFPLFAFAILLTLLPLLLPTQKHYGYSFFSLAPTGQTQRSASAAGSGSRNGVLGNLTELINATDSSSASASANAWGDDETLKNEGEVERRTFASNSSLSGEGDEDKDVVIPDGNVAWLGGDGPSIYVGALQICSKSNSNGSITCTSSSQAAYHAALLPLSLGEALLTLPSSPVSPILLLVSGIALLVGCIIYLFQLFSSACTSSSSSSPCVKALLTLHLWRRRPPTVVVVRGESSSPSAHFAWRGRRTNGNGEGNGIGRVRLHLLEWNFVFVLLVALGLAASAMVQIRDVRRSKSLWDGEQAEEVGLVFQWGILTYLLPVLPVTHLIIIIFYSLPILSAMRERKQQAIRVTAGATALSTSRKAQMPQITVDNAEEGPSPQEPQEQEDRSRPNLRDVEPPSPAASASVASPRPKSELVKGVRLGERRSWRRSWRNTFGTIGAAV